MYVCMYVCMYVFLFVCVEVLQPSQPNGVMSSAVSYLTTPFTGQAWSSKRLTSIVHILSPETDNYPSCISGRERICMYVCIPMHKLLHGYAFTCICFYMVGIWVCYM